MVQMQLFYCPNIPNSENFLDREESLHCAKVLRKSIGDVIDITDGKGKFYTAKLSEIHAKKCHFQILSERVETQKENAIHIAIAPTKSNDRIEWFVEKAVEIGIDKISFLQTFHSERKSINMDRIHKKAVSAMKQSVRATLPELASMENMAFFLKDTAEKWEGQKFIAHLEGENTPQLKSLVKPMNDAIILIGPEGGFSEIEISQTKEYGFQVAKLGDHRLRTETAGIVACTLLNGL